MKNTINMKNNLRKKINERGVSLDEYPDTYLAQRKKEAGKSKTYNQAFSEIIKMLKEMSWKDVTFISGPVSGGLRHEFPLLPEPIRLKIREAARIGVHSGNDQAPQVFKAKTDFSQGNFSFAKTFDNSEPSTANSIFMKVESEANLQRSHFPNSGIPNAIKGTNLGYKLYRALLEKFKYLTSNTGGTVSKDWTWQSIVSNKLDSTGARTEDDVNAIVSKNSVLAMVRNLPNEKKIRICTSFIESKVETDEITKKNFVIDDELKAILPKEILSRVDPEKREKEEKERREREEKLKRERDAAALASHGSRFELYAPYGINAHDWDIGDYVVVKQYLMQVGYTDLPVRKVVAKNGNEYTALKISDLAEYARSGNIPSNDPRKTRDKTIWVKTDLKPGQYNYMPDPTAGQTSVNPGTQSAGFGGRLSQRRAAAAGRTPTTTEPAATEPEQSSQQRRTITSFMRDGTFNVCIKQSEWDDRSRLAMRRKPIVPYLVKKIGTGRTATYKVMNGRTAETQNLSSEDYEALNLKKFNITQLERKNNVSEGDWVFVKDHRSAQGFACVVKNVTPAENRQPGLYLWTGETRPQYIGHPQVLWKLISAPNESLSTSLFRFDEYL